MTKYEIKSLFNLGDDELMMQSLTPVKDKVFGEKANTQSSVNKYFSVKHNQTLDRINYLKNLKVIQET